MTPRTDPSLRFCPQCAATLLWRSFEYVDIQHPACQACGYVLWQNPKPSVEALITRGIAAGTEVLLGKLAVGSSKGKWDAPGGFLNTGDRLLDALVRECHREMGIDVNVRELVGAYEQEYLGLPMLALVYRCEVTAGEPAPVDLIDEVRWFPLDGLPPIAYPAIEQALGDLCSRL